MDYNANNSFDFNLWVKWIIRSHAMIYFCPYEYIYTGLLCKEYAGEQDIRIVLDNKSSSPNLTKLSVIFKDFLRFIDRTTTL